MLGTGWKKEETLSEEQLRLEPQAGTDRQVLVNKAALVGLPVMSEVD